MRTLRDSFAGWRTPYQDLGGPVSTYGASFLTDGDSESWSLSDDDPSNGYFAAVNRGALRIGELWPHSGNRYRWSTRSGTLAVGETFVAAAEFLGFSDSSAFSANIKGGNDEIGIRYYADGTMQIYRWDNSISNYWTGLDGPTGPTARVVWFGIKRQATGAWDYLISLDGDYWTRLTGSSPGLTFTLESSGGDPDLLRVGCAMEGSNYPSQAAVYFVDVVTGI